MNKSTVSLEERIAGRLKKKGFEPKEQKGFFVPTDDSGLGSFVSSDFQVRLEYIPTTRDMQVILLTFTPQHDADNVPDSNMIAQWQQGKDVRFEPIINSARIGYQISYRKEEVADAKVSDAILGFISYVGRYLNKK